MAEDRINEAPLTSSVSLQLYDETEHFTEDHSTKHGFNMLQSHETLLFWKWGF